MSPKPPATRASAPSRGMARILSGADAELARWLADLEAQRKSRYTVKHYGLTLRQFQTWLFTTYPRRQRLRDVDPSELKQYQIVLSTQRKYAKNTLYISLKAIQAFYRYLELDDRAKALKPPKRGQGLPKYLTETEATRLLEAGADHPRTHAMLALLLYSGLRVGELCAILVPDIDFDEGAVRIRSGKGDKDRLVVAAPKCMTIVKAWVATRPATTSDYLFPGQGKGKSVSPITVQRLVLDKARKAGLEKRVTPHVLRHTLATTLLRRGGDIRFIQRMLGHASIATTQIYTHLDDAELKRMYDRARPEF